MIVTSVQIKTVKTQKHLYCPVFTQKALCFQSAFLHTLSVISASAGTFFQKGPASFPASMGSGESPFF